MSSSESMSIKSTTELKAGIKHDQGKLPWDLLPFEEIEEVVKVLQHGAEKYGPNNWQQLMNANDRYFAAAMRHMVAYKKGEMTDEESGLPHLAHATCCLLFMMWGDKDVG